MKFQSKWKRLHIELQTTSQKLDQIGNADEKESIFKSIVDLTEKSDKLQKMFEKAIEKLEQNESIIEITLEQVIQLSNEIEELIEVIKIKFHLHYLNMLRQREMRTFLFLKNDFLQFFFGTIRNSELYFFLFFCRHI